MRLWLTHEKSLLTSWYIFCGWQHSRDSYGRHDGNGQFVTSYACAVGQTHCVKKICLPAGTSFANGSTLVEASAAMMARAGVSWYACAIDLVTHVARHTTTPNMAVSSGFI
jgi:hypothetical protein